MPPCPPRLLPDSTRTDAASSTSETSLPFDSQIKMPGDSPDVQDSPCAEDSVPSPETPPRSSREDVTSAEKRKVDTATSDSTPSKLARLDANPSEHTDVPMILTSSSQDPPPLCLNSTQPNSFTSIGVLLETTDGSFSFGEFLVRLADALDVATVRSKFLNRRSVASLLVSHNDSSSKVYTLTGLYGCFEATEQESWSRLLPTYTALMNE